MSTCVHFSTFSGIIFSVGTRGRLRFAAIFLFWTYYISRGIVRVCLFANLLICPWLNFEPRAIEQFWPNAEPFTDVWAMTYFCTATCSLLAIYRLMEANFQQYSCWVADFIFQPVVLQVCGEPRSSGVVHVLHNWFSAFGNYHTSRTLQPGCVIFPWSQTSRKLGINSISHQPASSGTIAIVGLYRTVYEWGTSCCVVLPRSSFLLHSTCWQFVRRNSGRFLAQLQLRRGISLPILGLLAGPISPFSSTLDSIVDKVIYIDCVFRRCYTSIQQLAAPCSSLQPLACLCIMNFQLADGANPGPDYLGSTDECLGPGGNSCADNGTSMSWLLPVLAQ